MALWALSRYWVHLAGVSGGEKIYLGSSIIMEIYPVVSLVIGGRDGMDGRRRIWMMCSINRTRHQSPVLGDRPHHWTHFLIVNYMYLGRQYIYMLISPLPVHQGRREWVDGILPVWMYSYLISDNHSF